MRAPADKPAVVSPLTTLVEAQMDQAGLSSQAAAKLLADTLDDGTDPAVLFADFTKGSDATAQGSAAAARLLVLTQQQASAALAAAVGKTDISGGTISRVDIDKAVNARLVARNIRVSFGSGKSTTYYGCAVRNSDGSTRNCDAIGSGTASIEAVGDARVMRFTGVPAEAGALTYSRIFVERGGKVYYGYRDKLRVDNAVRLNAQGMDALFAQLGLSR